MGLISKTIIIATVASLAGCSDYSLPPKQIVADGETFYACGGLYVRSFKDGLISGDTYTVEFTDKFGDKVQLRGIRKVSIKDLSDEATETMPSSLPDPTSDKDWDGNSFENGTTYRWRDGAATLTDGRWEPAKYNRPNLSCNAKTGQKIDPAAVISQEEWEAMTPNEKAAFGGIITLPSPAK